MTTEEKTAAIQKLVANFDDNVAAKNAAHLRVGVEDLATQAIAEAFRADLAKIFAFAPPKTRKGG
jgi:hypothetical protein